MCGIFGIDNHDDAAHLTYLGLYALQHRGQESAGIVSWSGTQMHLERGMGLVADIFRKRVLRRLPGRQALGHTRYSTSGTSILHNAQPVVVKTSMGPLGIVHNGNLVNAAAIRERLEKEGSIFQTTSDTEVILHLMARNPREDVVESLIVALSSIQGAYSLLLLTDDSIIAARDPHGFRPLLLGDCQGSPCFASESCALDLLGASLVREVGLGEVVRSRRSELESFRQPSVPAPARCAFEHVYFSRPDSTVFGDAVSRARTAQGEALARESPADADLVVPVPDSGIFAALGFARASGTPYEFALIRNHYVGRTFIQPQQSIRDFGVKVKLNPVRHLIEGKKVVLVDDSIVRGTTSKKIVQMVREAGASEVHVRISSPPTAYPCHYGIDTPRRKELIANQGNVAETCRFIGADSLAYLTVQGVLGGMSGAPESYCTACWTGDYRVAFTPHASQRELFPIRLEEEES